MPWVRAFEGKLERRRGDRVTIAWNLERLVKQLIGILDLPGDQCTQGGLACTIRFLGIGPGSAEECLGRVVVLEFGQPFDRGNANLGLGILGGFQQAAREDSRPVPMSATISRRAATAFSRFQAADKRLDGLRLVLGQSSQARWRRPIGPARSAACSSWKRCSSKGFSKSSSLISQPSGSISTIRGFLADGIANSCKAASITIGTTRVLPVSSVISSVVGSLNRGV